MEVGNLIFGHSRGTYPVDRNEDRLWEQLRRLADALGCDTYFSPEFGNDVFVVRPYYWGDCDCGYEDQESEWGDANKHSDDCYFTEYGKLPEYGYDTHGRVCHEIDAKKLCEKHGIPWNGGRGSAVHCTCEHDAAWEKWSGEHDHSRACSIVLPNFLFKPTGFELRWYKYPLRDSYSSEKLDLPMLHKMVNECIRSLGKSPEDY